MTLPMCEFCGERPMRKTVFDTLACQECERDVLSWAKPFGGEERGETTEDERGEEMSRGPGYCMREIVRLLENAEGKSMTRRELEDALCLRGFRSDNILRAIRTLASMYEVSYVEARFPETSRITLPQPVANPIPDEEIYRLLGMS